MKGIWVAVPAYTGSIRVETAHSLNVETYAAINASMPFMVTFHEQDPIISRCRNAMVMNFLASDPKAFTDLIFLDSDVGFPSGTLLRLANHPVDVVGAVYPFRRDPIGFPMQLIKGKDKRDHNGLLEVAGLPAGCMRISRKALEAMVEKFPELEYTEANVPQGKAYALFDFVRQGKIFSGEDYVFCALAREAGFNIYCDPDIRMSHIGMKKFEGSVGEHLPPVDPFEQIHAFNAANK